MSAAVSLPATHGRAPAVAPTAAAAAHTSTVHMGRHQKRVAAMEARLQAHMETEDRRVKDLTEGLLYELLPAALSAVLPACEDPLKELDWERSRMVAGAALAASALMNAPPGFLEFLLCIPWRRLPQLYPASPAAAAAASADQAAAGDKGIDEAAGGAEALSGGFEVSADERRLLVNTRLAPQVMAPLMEFLYCSENAASVPPQLQVQLQQHQAQAQAQHAAKDAGSCTGCAHCAVPQEQAVTLEAVAALLDGATPLHCAAIRGNPAQVDHLLYCGADPLMRTASGDLPLELVPSCGQRGCGKQRRSCRCMPQQDQEVWECRSGKARRLLARACLAPRLSTAGGLLGWLHLAVLCLLALLGLVVSSSGGGGGSGDADGSSGAASSGAGGSEKPQAGAGATTFSIAYGGPASAAQRESVQRHMRTRREAAWAEAQQRTRALLARMRAEVLDGERHMLAAGQGQGAFRTVGLPPDEEAAQQQAAASSHGQLPARTELQQQRRRHQQHQCSQHDSDTTAICPWEGTGGGLIGSLHDTHTSETPTEGSGFTSGPAAAVAGGAVVDKVATGAAEAAFPCFMRALQALHSLELRGGITPRTLLPKVMGGAASTVPNTATAPTGVDALVTNAGDGDGTVCGQAADSARAAAVAPATAAAAAAPVGATPQNMSLFQELARLVMEDESLLVLHDEQARVYSHWAAATLAKFWACQCAGCLALAEQAIRSAHAQVAWLHLRARRGIAQRQQQQHQQQQEEAPAPSAPTPAADALAQAPRKPAKGFWAPEPAVASLEASLARVLSAHVGLLLLSEARAPPTRAAVWRADQCLLEWDRLCARGLGGSEAESEGTRRGAAALRAWSQAADSDLSLAEALLGSPIGPGQSLHEALFAAFGPAAVAVLGLLPSASSSDSSSSSSKASAAGEAPLDAAAVAAAVAALRRPVSQELVDDVQRALSAAVRPSPSMRALATGVADAAAAELAAAARLRELLRSGGGLLEAGARGVAVAEAVAALAGAIAAAEPYPLLSEEVGAARGLHERGLARAQATAKLEGVIERARQATAASLSATGAPASPSGAASNGVAASGRRGSGGGRGSVGGGRGSSGGGGGGVVGAVVADGALSGYDAAVWEQQARLLEAAVEDAKDANISISKAKRLLKELQAQSAAAEAALQLDALMARRPCGSAPLKTLLLKAEAAASAVGSSTTTSTTTAATAGAAAAPAAGAAGGTWGGADAEGGAGASAAFAEALLPRVQSARRRLEVERGAEALGKAAAQHRTVAELPKLEAAILSARKVGAEELGPESYRAASDLRARLTDAARARGALDAAVRVLQRKDTAVPGGSGGGAGTAGAGAAGAAGAGVGGSERPQEAEAVEAALQEALKWEDLLTTDCARAKDALDQWRAQAAEEAKLSRALCDGTPAPALARAIQDAAAAGVRVQGARRVLKLLQGLDAAVVQAVAEGLPQLEALHARLEAAEQGGVAEVLLRPAQVLAARLRAAAAGEALETAVKLPGDVVPEKRVAKLRSALALAESVLGSPVQDMVLHSDDHQQQQQEEGEAAPEPSAADRGSVVAAAGDPAQPAPECSSQGGTAAVSVPVPAGPASTLQVSGSTSFDRSDSIASSVCTSEASSCLTASSFTHAAGAAPAASSRSSGGTGSSNSSSAWSVMCTGGGGEGGGVGLEELREAVRKLAVQAYHALQRDLHEVQQAQEERDEQERLRREQHERERAERQRSDAERQERERAERERLAAEKREARAKASDKRVKVVWAEVGPGGGGSGPGTGGLGLGGGSGGGSGRRERPLQGPRELTAILVRSSDDGVAEAAAIAAVREAATAAGGSAVSKQQAPRGQRGAGGAKRGTSEDEAVRATATGDAPGQLQQPLHHLLQQQQQQQQRGEQAPHEQALALQQEQEQQMLMQLAAAAAAAAAGGDGDQPSLLGSLGSKHGRHAAAAAAAAMLSNQHPAQQQQHLIPLLHSAQQQQQLQQQQQQHGRSESMDILGEATTKLNREVLEMLDLGGHNHQPLQQHHQQQQQDSGQPVHLDLQAHQSQQQLHRDRQEQQQPPQQQQQHDVPGSGAATLRPSVPLLSLAVAATQADVAVAPLPSPAVAAVARPARAATPPPAPTPGDSVRFLAAAAAQRAARGGPPPPLALGGASTGAIGGAGAGGGSTGGATPRFRVVDLGGAGWGVDHSGAGGSGGGAATAGPGAAAGAGTAAGVDAVGGHLRHSASGQQFFGQLLGGAAGGDGDTGFGMHAAAGAAVSGGLACSGGSIWGNALGLGGDPCPSSSSAVAAPAGLPRPLTPPLQVQAGEPTLLGAFKERRSSGSGGGAGAAFASREAGGLALGLPPRSALDEGLGGAGSSGSSHLWRSSLPSSISAIARGGREAVRRQLEGRDLFSAAAGDLAAGGHLAGDGSGLDALSSAPNGGWLLQGLRHDAGAAAQAMAATAAAAAAAAAAADTPGSLGFQQAPGPACAAYAAADIGVCRFYLQGFCARGDTCQYMHIDPSVAFTAAAAAQPGALDMHVGPQQGLQQQQQQQQQQQRQAGLGLGFAAPGLDAYRLQGMEEEHYSGGYNVPASHPLLRDPRLHRAVSPALGQGVSGRTSSSGGGCGSAAAVGPVPRGLFLPDDLTVSPPYMSSTPRRIA